MISWYHSWIAAIRIARRDAWRAKGRSILVLAMIALPIVGVSAADLTMRSAQLSTAEDLERRLGTADAEVSVSSLGGPIYQTPNGDNFAPVGGYEKYEPPAEKMRVDVPQMLPAGAQVVKDSIGSAKLRTTHGLLETALREVDVRSPLVKGRFTLDRGRLPDAAGEIIATNAFLEQSGYFVGSRVSVRGMDASYRIVGAYELPNALGEVQVIAPPGTLLTPVDKALRAIDVPGVRAEHTYLVTVGGDGFTWNMVKEANAKGAMVISRAVILDKPADSEVPLYAQEPQRPSTGETRTLEMAILATVVGLAMLEICLLAGPAFAVGARRSRRQLGLVGANGGDRRHIRAIVLSGGLVIGAAAAVVGTVIGIALTMALRPLLEGYLGLRWGGFDVRPLELLAIGLLAVVTGLLAAIVPAVTASRQTVLASLTGRRGVRRANRVLPVIGLIAVAGGAAIALYGTVSDMGTLAVAGGSAIAELGVVALTPVLVGLFGRIGRWMPLSPRLALRDAVRNRGRTAPAVAAVLAAVAGTVAVATYQHSSEIQARHEYTADLPGLHGMVAVSDNSAHKEVPAVREALSKEFSLSVRADVDRIVVGRPGCDTYSSDTGCGRAEIIQPKEQRCPLYDSPGGYDDFTPERAKELRKDWRCAQTEHYMENTVLVSDEKLLTALAVTDPGAVSALKSGKAVSFSKQNVKDDKVTIRLITDPDAADIRSKGEEVPGEDKVLPVYQAPDSVEGWGVELILPPTAARSAGLTTAAFGSFFALDGAPDSEQRQRLDGALDQMGVDAKIMIEQGYQGDNSIELLALTLFAGLVTIGAAGIATGLAQADAEADLKTLAAVGAPPRVRRTLSGFQCGVIALMGVILGSAAGILPAVGLRLATARETERFLDRAVAMGYEAAGPEVYVPIAVPWETLGGLLIVVPLGAALLAALVTRSSGALARRAAG
ncbi:FtsX-like permease family protein [Streptomyces sp. NBC_01408]|uniref:FtsX-like permease family protein n=1 Tax=Streptomyces sp. NBC_01408 TaxID=2903855 RepID=UPI002254E0E3|nr:ABC transporter permease [Streptomyces sp. NBC_01408]MCX4692263.1 ABC transporter permease [Streptomyces sp. NBC_01408]